MRVNKINMTKTIIIERGKCSGNNLYRNSFITSCIKELRKGESDYVFTMAQIEEVKERLKPSEELVIEKEDDYYIIKLKR